MLQVTKLVIRHLAFHEEKRVDGRKLNELRPITCQVTFLLLVSTLAPIISRLRLDSMSLCTGRAFSRGVRLRYLKKKPNLKIPEMCLQPVAWPGSVHGCLGQFGSSPEVGRHVCVDRGSEGEEFHAALRVSILCHWRGRQRRGKHGQEGVRPRCSCRASSKTSFA